MKKKKLQCSSIGRKLLLVMTLICVVPLITIGITANIQAKTKLTEKLSTMSVEALSFIDDNFDKYLQSLKEVVDISSKNTLVENADKPEHSSELLNFFGDIVDSKKDLGYIYIGLADDKMKVFPHVDFPPDYKPSQRNWYIEAVDNGGSLVLSKPYVDYVTGEIVVTISKAIYRENRLVGVLAADFAIAAIARQVSDKKIGSTGYLFIFDENDVIVSHPDASLIGKRITDVNPDFSRRIQSADGGFLSYRGADGLDHFGAHTRNATTGWTICTSILYSELDQDTQTIRYTTIIVTAIMILISTGIAFVMSSGLSKNICKVVEAFHTAAEGDLSIRVDESRKDEFGEIGRGLNLMLNKVSDLLNNVILSSHTVRETSTNLASRSAAASDAVEDVTRSISEVAQGSATQAEDAQTGLTEMENMARQLDDIEAHSEQIHKIFSYTKELSETGFATIDTLTEKSEEAKHATNEVSRVVEDMYNSSLQISNISDALASITKQTNLLSLNAGIEAARAGDAGRGFVVVANEIRKLAEESKASTEEIKVIIEGIQSKTSMVAESIKITQDAVRDQDSAVTDTKEIFGKILNSITEMSGKVSNIAQSIRHTAENKDALLSVIHRVSSVSQEGAAAIEEVTASAEEINANIAEFVEYAGELKNMADDLNAEINKFRI